MIFDRVNITTICFSWVWHVGLLNEDNLQLMRIIDTFADSTKTFILGSCLGDYVDEIFQTLYDDNPHYIHIPVFGVFGRISLSRQHQKDFN